MPSTKPTRLRSEACATPACIGLWLFRNCARPDVRLAFRQRLHVDPARVRPATPASSTALAEEYQGWWALSGRNRAGVDGPNSDSAGVDPTCMGCRGVMEDASAALVSRRPAVASAAAASFLPAARTAPDAVGIGLAPHHVATTGRSARLSAAVGFVRASAWLAAQRTPARIWPNLGCVWLANDWLLKCLHRGRGSLRAPGEERVATRVDPPIGLPSRSYPPSGRRNSWDRLGSSQPTSPQGAPVPGAVAADLVAATHGNVAAHWVAETHRNAAAHGGSAAHGVASAHGVCGRPSAWGLRSPLDRRSP